AAHNLGARAFTVGSDVHFNAGEFAPGSKEGDRLLAHELTHVVQAQKSGIQRKEEPEAAEGGGGEAAPAEAAGGEGGGGEAGAEAKAEGGGEAAPAEEAPPVAAKLEAGQAGRKIFRDAAPAAADPAFDAEKAKALPKAKACGDLSSIVAFLQGLPPILCS